MKQLHAGLNVENVVKKLTVGDKTYYVDSQGNVIDETNMNKILFLLYYQTPEGMFLCHLSM